LTFKEEKEKKTKKKSLIFQQNLFENQEILRSCIFLKKKFFLFIFKMESL